MSALKVEITSPNGILFNGNCHLAVVPATTGDLGVMAGCESILTSLRQGEVVLFDEKQNTIKSFAVNSGFAQVQTSGALSILVD